MEENKNIQAESTEKEEIKNEQATATEIEVIDSEEEKRRKNKELREKLEAQLKEQAARGKEANEAMSQGKGKFRLETPILAGDEEITELVYDFTELTGMEYADAMDSDMNAQQIFRITYRQGLALFAKAAAKQTDKLDSHDIIERMGMTDAVEAVQLATLFFSASTRAGRMRISKK